MNCKSFLALAPQEQNEFIGKLVHLARTREQGFMAARMLVEAAEVAGVYKEVKFGHLAVYNEGLAVQSIPLIESL